ncbi:MAG TPA: MoaD/ThiS family protein [Flavobacteriales bacterium]
MKIKLIAFGIAKDVFGASTQLEVNDSMTLAELSAYLKDHYSASNQLPVCRMAVNQEIVEDIKTFVLKDGDEVAILPPVSGG